MIDHLESFGWDVEEVEEEAMEKWEDELWMIKSHWKPQRVVAYITALIDPMHDGAREKGQYVWAYGLAKEKPKTYEDAQSVSTLLLGKAFNSDVEVFIDKLMDIRDSI